MGHGPVPHQTRRHLSNHCNNYVFDHMRSTRKFNDIVKLYNADIMDVYETLKDYKYRMYDIHNKEVKDEEHYNNLFLHASQARIVCKGD